MRRPRFIWAPAPRASARTASAAVLDGVGASLLWIAMIVDWRRAHWPKVSQSRRRRLPAGWCDRRPVRDPPTVPVVAMLVSDLALIALDRSVQRVPGYATFAWSSGSACMLAAAGPWSSTCGVAGLIVLWTAAVGVATASSWISTVLTSQSPGWLGEPARARAEAARTRRGPAAGPAEGGRGRRAVSEERLRIARDLHDVVAHSMSVIAVQAGVANHLMDERPELVRQSLSTIEVTARQGLVVMRRLLGVLRSEENEAQGNGSGPAEGLRDLDRLLEQFHSAGLQLDVTNPDQISDLPAALDISAYRIVQEGLTNVLRHGGSAAQLTIRRSEAALQIEIQDDGRRRAPRRRARSVGSGRVGPRPHRHP